MKDLKPYLVISAVLLLAYGPMVRADYGFGDDYNLLPHQEPLGYLHLMDGRLVLAVAQDYVHRPISHISQYGYLRFVGSLGVCAIAILLYQQSKVLFESCYQRIGLAIAIGLLPCLQTYVGQAILWLAIYTGFLAMWACARTFAATSQSQGGLTALFKAYAPPLLVMVLASAMYQPLISMYWVMAFIYLLDDRFLLSASYRKRIGIVLVTGVLYFVACLVVYKLSFLLHDQIPKSREQFTHDPLYKIYWFLRIQVPLAFNFWHLMDLSKRYANLVLPLLSFLTIVSGYILSIRQLSRSPYSSQLSSCDGAVTHPSKWVIAAHVILLVGVFSLTHIHWLILAIVPQSYRIIAPLGITAFILVFWSLDRWFRFTMPEPHRTRFQKSVVSVFVVIAFWYCQHHIEAYWINPQGIGYRYMLMTLRDQADARTNHVHVIQQTEQEGLVSEVFVELFGRPASERAWTIDSMTRAAIRDSGIPNQIEKVSFGTSEVAAPEGDSVLVLDMRKLKLMRLQLDSK